MRKVRGASQEAVALNTGRVFLVRQWARIRLLARRNPAPFPSVVARSKSTGLDGVPLRGHRGSTLAAVQSDVRDANLHRQRSGAPSSNRDWNRATGILARTPRSLGMEDRRRTRRWRNERRTKRISEPDGRGPPLLRSKEGNPPRRSSIPASRGASRNENAAQSRGASHRSRPQFLTYS